MADINKYNNYFALFLEAGFIAVNQADEDSARKLFKAAQLLNNQSSLPKIGEGYLHFHKLELHQAETIFNEVLANEPENEMCKTFKGMCLSLMPKKMAEGEKILHEIAEKATSDETKQVANTTLEFVEKNIKKAPSPAEIQPKQAKQQ